MDRVEHLGHPIHHVSPDDDPPTDQRLPARAGSHTEQYGPFRTTFSF